MVRFAETGILTDRFLSIRPFTPAERVEILTLLRDRYMQNPYFNLYFRQDGSAAGSCLTMYEDAGILLLAPGEGDITGNLFTSAEFMTVFGEYFENVLLRSNVLPKKETGELLEKLIGIASRAG